MGFLSSLAGNPSQNMTALEAPPRDFDLDAEADRFASDLIRDVTTELNKLEITEDLQILVAHILHWEHMMKEVRQIEDKFIYRGLLSGGVLAAHRGLVEDLVRKGEELASRAVHHRELLKRHFGYDADAIQFGIEALRLGLAELHGGPPTEQVMELQARIFGGTA